MTRSPILRPNSRISAFRRSSSACGPPGWRSRGALETAFGVAAQAHQNHSNNVQSTVKALAATGKNYQATEDETELAATRLRPLILSERDDTQA